MTTIIIIIIKHEMLQKILTYLSFYELHIYLYFINRAVDASDHVTPHGTSMTGGMWIRKYLEGGSRDVIGGGV